MLSCKQSSCRDCPSGSGEGCETQGPGKGVETTVEIAERALSDARDPVVSDALAGHIVACLWDQENGTPELGTQLVLESESISGDPLAEREVQVDPERHSVLEDVDGTQTDVPRYNKSDSDRHKRSFVPHETNPMLGARCAREAPAKHHEKVLAVTDQNGGQPPDTVICNWLDAFTPADLDRLQGEDAIVSKVRQWKRDDDRPSREQLLAEGDDIRALISQWSSLEIRDDLLYRKKVMDVSGRQRTVLQLVATQEIKEQAFGQLHSSKTGGHLGINRTLDNVRRRFYWPGCKTDIRTWCQRCTTCAQIKAGPRYKSKMHQVPCGSRFDRVFMDILGELPESDRGNKYILVITDGFTKWTQAIPLPNQMAQTVADALMTHVISLFGVPRQIHTDQGRNFESNLFAEVCQLLGIAKSCTTPYRPQSDGQTERFNRTLQQMLKAYVNDTRDDWDDHLPYVMMAYRATVHDSTSVTPNLMFLGTENVLPIDLVVGVPPLDEHPQCPIEYVEWLRQTIFLAHEVARKSLKKSALQRKRNYDLGAKPTNYRLGEFVWRWYPPTAKCKLGKGWTGPYKVVGCPNHLNYLIQKEVEGRVIRVHVDHLKPYHGDTPPGWPESDNEIDTDDVDDIDDVEHDSSTNGDTEEEASDRADSVEVNDENVNDVNHPNDGFTGNRSATNIDDDAYDNEQSVPGTDVRRTEDDRYRRSRRQRRPPRRLDL